MTCLNENRHYIWVSNGTLGQCRILEFRCLFFELSERRYVSDDRYIAHFM